MSKCRSKRLITKFCTCSGARHTSNECNLIIQLPCEIWKYRILFIYLRKMKMCIYECYYFHASTQLLEFLSLLGQNNVLETTLNTENAQIYCLFIFIRVFSDTKPKYKLVLLSSKENSMFNLKFECFYEHLWASLSQVSLR